MLLLTNLVADCWDESYMVNCLLILDKNNSLYIYGENIFGIKINNGEAILDSPIKFADNVKEYGNNYYINMNNVRRWIVCLIKN